jgi:hypothetical protein
MFDFVTVKNTVAIFVHLPEGQRKSVKIARSRLDYTGIRQSRITQIYYTCKSYATHTHHTHTSTDLLEDGFQIAKACNHGFAQEELLADLPFLCKTWCTVEFLK